MAIILKDEGPGTQIGPSLSRGLEQLGTGYGQGISSGLQALANLKLQDFSQRQQAALQQQIRNQQVAQRAQAWQQGLGLPQGHPLGQLLGQAEPTEVRALLDRLEGLNVPMKGRPGQEQQPGAPQTQQLGGGLTLGPGSQERRHREQMDIAQKKLKLAEKREERAKTLEERQQGYKEQQSLKPFLTESVKSYQNQKKASSLAQEMKEILQAKYKKFPGAITGNLPTTLQNLFIRDKDVRSYAAKANELVTLLAGTRKGLPTNFKIMLEKLSKADLNQPIGTQFELLDAVIRNTDKEKNLQKFIHSLKNKETGEYPLDLEQKTVEYDLAGENPLEYPEYYKEGTVYEDDNGKRFVVKNKQWVGV